MPLRRIFGSLVLCFIITGSLHAQWRSLGDLDAYTIEGNRVTLTSGSSSVQITMLASDLIRVRRSRDGRWDSERTMATLVAQAVRWDKRLNFVRRMVRSTNTFTAAWLARAMTESFSQWLTCFRFSTAAGRCRIDILSGMSRSR
jgi:hypothetical protein